MTLSVVIITRNEEGNIGRCLETVKWADEIIIVDALSRDKTVEIAKKYTTKAISRKWVNFFDQRSFALALASCDFVLIMDADEALDRKAEDEIKGLLAANEYCEGYCIIRNTHFLGKLLLFAEKPEPIMRLFKRGRGYISTKMGRGHEDYSVNGQTKLLGGRIEHYTSHTINERLKKIDRYSTLWAEEEAERRDEVPSSFKTAYVMGRSFAGNFFIRGAFMDGIPGFIWCGLKAVENFLKYAKLYLRLTDRKYIK